MRIRVLLGAIVVVMAAWSIALPSAALAKPEKPDNPAASRPTAMGPLREAARKDASAAALRTRASKLHETALDERVRAAALAAGQGDQAGDPGDETVSDDSEPDPDAPTSGGSDASDDGDVESGAAGTEGQVQQLRKASALHERQAVVLDKRADKLSTIARKLRDKATKNLRGAGQADAVKLLVKAQSLRAGAVAKRKHAAEIRSSRFDEDPLDTDAIDTAVTSAVDEFAASLTDDRSAAALEMQALKRLRR